MKLSESICPTHGRSYVGDLCPECAQDEHRRTADPRQAEAYGQPKNTITVSRTPNISETVTISYAAIPFLDLVIRVREAQNEYFRTRRYEDQRKAMTLESMLDRFIYKILGDARMDLKDWPKQPDASQQKGLF